MYDFGSLIVFVSHLKASQQQVTGIDLLDLCAGTWPPSDLLFSPSGIMHCFLGVLSTILPLTGMPQAFFFCPECCRSYSFKQARDRELNVDT